MSFRDYIEENHDQFIEEVEVYARENGVSFEEAQRDVRDMWLEGFCDSAAAARTTDWDWGQE